MQKLSQNESEQPAPVSVYTDGSANNKQNEILRLQIETKRLERQEALQKEKQYYQGIIERTRTEKEQEERKF